MKGFGNMMKEAQKLQAQMEKMQQEIAQKKVDATAGGGMVTVECNGKQELLSIKIDPEVINKDDAQMLEDLVLAACNEALRKSKELENELVGQRLEVAGGFHLGRLREPAGRTGVERRRKLDRLPPRGRFRAAKEPCLPVKRDK